MIASGTKKRRRPSPRAIITLDLDCFYASVAIRARPHLKDKPVVVVQKQLCVTSNYVARQRAHGAVQKMTPVSKALKACPDLVLIDGSDLTPFREANAEVMSVVREFLSSRISSVCAKLSAPLFDCPCQKLGFDEVFIDITRLVASEVSVGGRPWSFAGHVFGQTEDDEVRRTLMIASQFAHDIRHEITTKTELTLCAGVGNSKLLAKLAVNMNKPNDQTTFLPDTARDYISSLPARSLPGFGYATELKIHEWAKEHSVNAELHTAADMLRCFGGGRPGVKKLASILGTEASAETILGLCRGEDDAQVRESGDAQKSITSMDSFRSCTTMEDVRNRVMTRAKDLVTRLQRDAEQHARRPKTLTVSFRFRGDGFVGTMRAIPMPTEVSSLCSSKGANAISSSVQALSRATLHVLEEHGNVSPNSKFDLTLIAVGATNFNTDKNPRLEPNLSKFFRKDSNCGATGQNEDKLGSPTGPATREGNLKNLSKESSTAESREAESSKAANCPICNRPLSRNVMQATMHVDACLRHSRSKVEVPRKTSLNTRPVDSFFRKR